MECLHAHRPNLKVGCDEAAAKAAIPISNVNSAELVEWISESKALAAPIEADIKDAKRRVSAAKGPKKRKVAAKSDGEDDASCASE